jgi:group I intron endonuclease
MIIYKITNKVNGKSYIGQTIQPLKRRWQQHCWPSNKGKKTVLYRAIKKYGKENFIIEEIYTSFSIEELNRAEDILIKTHNTMLPIGYNIKPGGNRPGFSEETRKKQSEAKKKGFIPWNKGLTKEDDPRIGNQGAKWLDHPNFGKPGYWKDKRIPREYVEKMRASKIGKPFTITEKYLNSRKEVGKKLQIKILCHQNGIVYSSFKEAEQELNISSGNISRVVSGKQKHIKGYTFKRV